MVHRTGWYVAVAITALAIVVWSLSGTPGSSTPATVDRPGGSEPTSAAVEATTSDRTPAPRVLISLAPDLGTTAGWIDVEVEWSQGMSPEPLTVVVAGLQGSFSKSWVPSGTSFELAAGLYEVRAAGRTVETTSAWVRCVGASHRSVRLRMRGIERRDITVAATHATRPVGGARVRIIDPDLRPEQITAVTDGNGLCRLTIDEHWETRRWVEVTHPEFGRGMSRLRTRFPGGEVRRVTVVLTNAATITIRTDPPGQELERVALVSGEARVDRELVPSLLTHAGERLEPGVWTVKGVPAGRYLVMASSNSHAEAWRENEFQPGCLACGMPRFECTGEDAEITVVLTRVHQLLITTGMDAPVVACLLDASREQRDLLYTDEGRLIERWSKIPALTHKRLHRIRYGRGSVTFDAVRQGKYWLFVSGIDGSGGWQQVVVEGDQRVFAHAGREGGAVAGTASGAEVVRARHRGEVRSFGVDEAGRFRAEYLRPGEWEFWTGDGAVDPQFVYVAPGSEGQIALDVGKGDLVAASGRIEGLGPGRIRLAGSVLQVDGEGRFAGAVHLGAGDPTWWVYTDANRKLAGRSKPTGSEFHIRVTHVSAEWSLPAIGGSIAEATAHRDAAPLGDVREASCRWTPPAHPPGMPPGRYHVRLRRTDGAIFVGRCEIGAQARTVVTGDLWEALRLRILFADGGGVPLGEGVLTRDRAVICPIKCDQDGWARIDGVTSGPADVWIRMPDGKLRRQDSVSINLGKILPETVSIR